MCELLGITFNEPVSPSLSFRGFRHRASRNPHGWGLASFDDAAARIVKEPLRGDESKMSRFLRDYRGLSSCMFVAHVRLGSVGGKSLANTHPFGRELRGRDFVFAHNGTIAPAKLSWPIMGRFQPIGTTDSEQLMCALLNWLTNNDIALSDFSSIEDFLHEANQAGNMNLLFSDGESLFAYYDHRSYKGLHFVQRKAPFEKVSLVDEDWKVDLAAEKVSRQRGFIIATAPLTDEEWEKMPPGALFVFKDGELVYGNDSV